MRITIVQGAFLPVPPLLGGAVEKRWFLLAKEFARMGHEVTHVSRTYRQLSTEEVVDGVRYLRVQGHDTPANGLLLKTLDFLYSLRVRKILPKADILVTNTFWLPILIRHQRLGKVIVDVARMPRGQIRFYRRAALLRANSKSVERAILASDPKAAGRTVLVPNPLTFVPTREPAWEEKKNVFLYAGRLHPEKGIELLLKAFTRFKKETGSDWRLRLIGPAETSQGGGGRKWKEALQARFAEENSIEWVEPIFDAEKLNEEYSRAKVFVYPSLAEKGETFGLAPLEAMAWGCVPLVSDLDCFKDFIEPERNGFIFSHREEPIANLVRQLKLMSELPTEQWIRFAEEAFQVRQTHSIAKIAREFLEKFETI